MPWVSSAHPDSVLLSFTFFKHISSQKRSFFSGKLKSKRGAAGSREGSSSPEQLSNKKLSGSFVAPPSPPLNSGGEGAGRGLLMQRGHSFLYINELK